jgi:hypothetical protein
MNDISVLVAREAAPSRPDAVEDGTMIDHVDHPPPERRRARVTFVPPPGAPRGARRIALAARREHERYLSGW